MSQMELPQDPRFVAAPRGTWFSRNWLWFIPSIVVLPMCLCGGCGGGLFYIGTETMRSSEPYRMTIEAVAKNPAVVQELGEPIVDATVFPTGGVNINNNEGDANFILKVSGPKGEADVSSEAVRQNGQWRLTYLRVSFPTAAEDVTIIEQGGFPGPVQRPDGAPEEMREEEEAVPGET